MVKNCKHCEKEFHANNVCQIYCNKECRDAFYNKRARGNNFTPIEVNCLNCGDKFTPKSTAVHCSKKCALQYCHNVSVGHIEKDKNDCKFCNKDITHKRVDAKYCGSSCKIKDRAKNKTLNCSMCESEFTKVGNKTTCSDECRDEKRRIAHRERSRRHYIKVRAGTPEGIIKDRLRTRFYNALKGETKSASTEELLGCTIAQAKSHLESQFLEGMS